MNREFNKSWVLFALPLFFLGMALVFALEPRDSFRRELEPPAEPANATPATVRISAAELFRTGGDTSIMDCYACHDEKEAPILTLDDSGKKLTLPEEHKDLILFMRNCSACHTEPLELDWDDDGNVVVPPGHEGDIFMGHGQHDQRNSHCFNCHNPEKIDELITRDGTILTFSQANQLCASCHGPTYRDWEKGIHGRVSGFWNNLLGESRREDCASCHDPHAPAFPRMIPTPGPRPLHGQVPPPSSDHP